MHLNKALRAEMQGLYLPLGQVAEQFLPYDADAMTRNHRLWRIMAHQFRFDVPVVSEDLQEAAIVLEGLINDEILPKKQFTRHLIMQYVTPEYIESRQGKERKKWGAPYYRYDIDEGRQALLMAIAEQMGDAALVVYAAPAVHTMKSLLEANMAGTVVRSTNCKTAKQMKNKHRLTYTRFSDQSVVYGSGRKVDNVELPVMLREAGAPPEPMQVSDAMGRPVANRLFIEQMRAAVTDAVKQTDTHVRRPYEMMTTLIADLEKYPLLYCLLTMNIFRQLTGTQWAMV